MALTANVKIRRRGQPAHGAFGYYVAASEKVFGGGLVAVNAAGNLVRPQTSGALRIVGVASRDYDNSASGSVGADLVQVERGWFEFTVAGATATGIDQSVYCTDDNTLTMSVPGPGLAAAAVAGNANFAVANHVMNGLGSASANTGNATCSAVTAAATAKLGTYLVLFSAATAFTVIDPNGDRLKTAGATGTAFADGGLGFTITVGGTPMVSGDTFTITVADTASPFLVGTLSGIENSVPTVRIKGS